MNCLLKYLLLNDSCVGFIGAHDSGEAGGSEVGKSKVYHYCLSECY